MNYEGWMVSLYELYKEEYNRYYQVNNERFLKRLRKSYNLGGIKRVFKDLFHFPSKWKMIGFIIYCLVEIIALITYLVGVIKVDSGIIFIGMALMIIPPLILIKTAKFSIDSYEKSVIVIKKILIQKRIDSDKKIDRLIMDSEKYISKNKRLGYIFQLLQISIPVITSLLGNSKVTNKYSEVISNFINNNFEVLSSIIILSIFTIGIYLMILNRPDGKKQKIKELNNILRISLLYK